MIIAIRKSTGAIFLIKIRKIVTDNIERDLRQRIISGCKDRSVRRYQDLFYHKSPNADI
jgi:hypothetical protein